MKRHQRQQRRHGRRAAAAAAAAAAGFTLVEVMVALIVIAIGLLGIAKLQGLAVSNTGVARMRSLAAIEATSLAAAMHANRSFWAVGSAPSFANTYDTVSNTNTFTLNANALTVGAAGDCQNVICTPARVAGYDVYQWLASLNATLPSATETVTCQNSATQPESCTIKIEWTEQMGAANSTEGAVAATQAIVHPQYELYVVP